MKFVVCAILLLSSLTASATAEEAVARFEVFRKGESGYGGIRIPALLVTAKGTVLAFAEGRRTLADQSGNDIIVKRSSDSGAQWSPLAVVQDSGDDSLNNPVPVQDQKSGRIFLFYQRYPVGLSEFNKGLKPGTEGANVVRNYFVSSDDDGVTWSAPVDVTATTKREYATTLASGPGTGIQLTRGPQKGRLVIPYNEGPVGQWNVYAVYSDDGGKSWQAGANAPEAQVQGPTGSWKSRVNEVQMAELTDGSVMLNTRDEGRTSACRKSALSRDGGKTWSPVKEEPQLVAPPCAGSIFRYEFGTDTQSPGGHLLYSGPFSTGKREKGTVHLSLDDGRTWSQRRLLEPGWFAYSVLAKLPDGRVGCLYETGAQGAYEQICLARFSLQWLKGGEAVPATTSAPIQP